jgi:non-ribosomal peptide synthase protein (TIGR01720 family)
VVVELEGHGREELGLEGLDVTSAVGWFTSLYPVVLEAEWGASGESLKAVKEQLRAVPRKGVGYGVWRFLRNDGAATAVEGRVGGEVSFNYLGQLDTVLQEDAPFMAAAESAGESRYGGDPRPFKLSVVGSVRGGELVITWKYSRNLHLHETIEGVAASYLAALNEIIEHCSTTQAGGFTPSDFPMVNLNQQQLDKIISRVGKARLS